MLNIITIFTGEKALCCMTLAGIVLSSVMRKTKLMRVMQH